MRPSEKPSTGWAPWTAQQMTSPTRTRGYVYCGVVHVPEGETLKAIAYKSGMADSPVAEAAYPADR